MKKIIPFFLVLTMLFSYVPLTLHVKASTLHTRAEAVQWINSQNGQALDYDGSYGAQCVDLIYYYYSYLGVQVMGGNAKDYTWNTLPDGWQRIQYYEGFVPQPGDIFVNALEGGGYGHVGLIINANASTCQTLEQNYNWQQYCQIINRSCNYIQYIIRPDFTDLPPTQNPWVELYDPTDVSESRVKLNAIIHNPGGLYISSVGCSIWNSDGSFLKEHTKAMNPLYTTSDNVPAWFWTDLELGLELTPGTSYQYQIAVILSDGSVFRSDRGSFRTGGKLPGDVNNDGVIDESDVIRLLRYVSGVWKNVEVDESQADVNNDGIVDETDSIRLTRYYSGVWKGVILK